MKPPAPPAAIKWTDEEWGRIADKLHNEKGDALLNSDTLEEIKARDVFEAQQVLPSERHRKLISIAQGFQGIRSRLHTIFKKMQADGATLNLAATLEPAPEQERDNMPTPEPSVQPEAAAQQVLALHAPADEVPSASPAADAEEPAPDEAQPTLPPQAAKSPSTQERAPAAPSAAPRTAAPEPEGGAPAKNDFIEMARPFIAMVCEEFASALAKALAAQPGAAVLASTRPEAPQRQRQGGERQRPPVEAAPQAPRPPAATEHFEEDPSHPTEVQPLFDPKLPPSANSDFKPMIGLVATRAHEYEDLQMLYPQLQLCIVQADAIRGPDAFRNCQRIIGLREEVPPATDDMLRRTLRHRYVRLNGGATRVREQLNSWLDKPGSINSAPRPQQRNDKRQGTGGNGKKRHKWPPRADRG